MNVTREKSFPRWMICVTACGLLVLPSVGSVGQEPGVRSPIEADRQQPEVPVRSDRMDAVLESMTNAHSLAPQRRPTSFDLAEPRAELLASPSNGSVLRTTAEDNRVRFAAVDPVSDEPLGSWDIGIDSLPGRVQAREFSDGDVIAVASIAAGVHKHLAVGWLRWGGTEDGGRRLATRRFLAVDSLTYESAGDETDPAQDLRVDPSAVLSAEIADWDPESRTVSLVLQMRDGALEASVRFTDDDLPLDMAGAHWRAQREPRSLRATWIARGSDARSVVVRGSRFVILRDVERHPVTDPFAVEASLSVSRKQADGTWASIVTSGVVFVERGYSAWANQEGELCVSTPKALDGEEQTLVSYRLVADETGESSWRLLETGSTWRGRMEPGQRLLMDGAQGPRPDVVVVSRDGVVERVPAVR